MGRWRGFPRRDARRTDTQRVFSFRERSRRRERAFKVGIFAATVVAVIAIIAGSQTGRYGALVATNRVRWGVRSLLGLEPPREEIEEERQRQRWIGVDSDEGRPGRDRGRGRAARPADAQGVPQMDPDTAVIRWGNFDGTLVLSSGVFEPDDAGRSYRFKPGVRSVWFIGVSLRGGHLPVPGARHSGGARRGWIARGDLCARVGPGDQLVGVSRARARHQGPAPRDRAGGFRDPGRARRRRPDAACVPRAGALPEDRPPGIGAQCGGAWVLDRTVLLHPRTFRRADGPPVRDRGALRQ